MPFELDEIPNTDNKDSELVDDDYLKDEIDSPCALANTGTYDDTSSQASSLSCSPVYRKRRSVPEPSDEDRRTRNRLAAERSRRRKRNLIESLQHENGELLSDNNSLKSKVTQLETEVTYLKSLIVFMKRNSNNSAGG